MNFTTPLVTNNVIARNYAATGAGISWASGGGGISIINNTIVDNTGRYAIFASGLTGESRLVSNILVSPNTEAALFCDYWDASDPPSIAFNDVFNTTSGPRYGGVCPVQTGANGNIAADPLLIDPAAGDFHLGPGSPAIDAGTNAGTPSDDIDGDSRPIDGNGDGIAIADMGADELRPSDTTPPVITLPPDISVHATSPAGANVTFAVTATDEDPANPTVTCTPPSGSVFKIGDTQVVCSATDAAGYTAMKSFSVQVKGTSEQVADLITLVDSYNLRLLGTALHDKLVKVQEFLAANKPKRACEKLDGFLAQVKEQRGKRISVEQADRLTLDARRIKAVIGC